MELIELLFALLEWLLCVLDRLLGGNARVPRVLSEYELEILRLIAKDGSLPVGRDDRFPYLRLTPQHVALGFGTDQECNRQARDYRNGLRDLIVRRFVRSCRSGGPRRYIPTSRGTAYIAKFLGT